jgi:protein-S-isoprenylcysteine O-methyltransferase Ste14
MRKISIDNLILALIHALTGTLLLWVAIFLYRTHPYYQNYIHSGISSNWGIIFFALAGILWGDALWKLVRTMRPSSEASAQEDSFPQTDLLLLYFAVLRIARDRKLVIDAETKRALLYVLLKLFFLPIMANIMAANIHGLLVTARAVQTGILDISADLIYQVWFNAIFLIDGAIFAFGYLFAANWLGSKVKSVDPTVLGWVAALSTYPPFNGVTGNLIPMVKQASAALSAAPEIIYFLGFIVLICHTMFVVASLSLGTRASNLTSRGVVSWGLYRYVRHPAYAFKLTAWFIEGLMYATNLAYFMGWIGFAGIYALRAWTEERHLSSTDPEYVEYQHRVKWRFIPGVL